MHGITSRLDSSDLGNGTLFDVPSFTAHLYPTNCVARSGREGLPPSKIVDGQVPLAKPGSANVTREHAHYTNRRLPTRASLIGPGSGGHLMRPREWLMALHLSNERHQSLVQSAISTISQKSQFKNTKNRQPLCEEKNDTNGRSSTCGDRSKLCLSNPGQVFCVPLGEHMSAQYDQPP